MNFYVHSIEYKDLLKNTQKQCFHENKIAVLYMLNLKVISIVKIKKTRKGVVAHERLTEPRVIM